MLVIRAKHIDNAGNVTFHKKPLREYLMAKAVKPEAWQPGDAEAEKIVSKIDMSIVPVGTTHKDVEEFERMRGNIKGKRLNKFDEVMARIEAGEDITDIEDADKVIVAAQTDKEAKTKKGNGKAELDDATNFDAVPQTKKISPYSVEQLAALSQDQMHAVIDTLPLAGGLKSNLKRIKDKDKQVIQVFQLLGGK